MDKELTLLNFDYHIYVCTYKQLQVDFPSIDAAIPISFLNLSSHSVLVVVVAFVSAAALLSSTLVPVDSPLFAESAFA